MMSFNRLVTPVTGAIAFCAAVVAVCAMPAAAAEACSARSGAVVPPVVELYTSEGCNSCPPADKWLSQLKADPSVVGLAFHVDYWDRLGWKDRFDSPAYTQRQDEQHGSSGSRFSATPQVLVNGVYKADWSSAKVAPAAVAAPPEVQLMRDGNHVTAVVTAAPGAASNAPARWAAYWAVTEQGYVSEVESGENAGVTLKHDYVVRDYRKVAPWSSGEAAATLRFDLASAADPAHPRQVNLVILDADTGRPVQAVKLGC